MATKKTGIQKAIDALEADRAVLDAAIARLKAEQAKKPAAPKRSRAPLLAVDRASGE